MKKDTPGTEYERTIRARSSKKKSFLDPRSTYVVLCIVTSTAGISLHGLKIYDPRKVRGCCCSQFDPLHTKKKDLALDSKRFL